MQYKGYEIELVQDEDAQNPRTEYDNLGKMVCFHKRYNLGDEHRYCHSDFNGWEGIAEKIEEDAKAEGGVAVMLPLYLYDHSGITIRCHNFSDIDSHGWDWGQVGYIYLTKKQVRSEWGRCTKKNLEKAEKYIRSEVETYDQYLTGDVWGYQIKDADGEELDSCWGFFGEKYCEQSAKEVVDAKVMKSEKSAG
jgi:hypothetical protein